MVNKKRPSKKKEEVEGFDDFDELEEMQEEEEEQEQEQEQPEEIEKSPEDLPEEVEEEVESEPSHSSVAFEASPDVDVQLVAVMGKHKITLRDLLDLKMGSVVDLKRPPNEMVDLVANGKLIARGELVEIDGKLGVKILKMVR